MLSKAIGQSRIQEYQLPRTLTKAALRFKNSEIGKELFGETFVNHYSLTREWEDQQQRGAITDWQLKRYFEIIYRSCEESHVLMSEGFPEPKEKFYKHRFNLIRL